VVEHSGVVAAVTKGANSVLVAGGEDAVAEEDGEDGAELWSAVGEADL
jgi:hypothetical protein